VICRRVVAAISKISIFLCCPETRLRGILLVTWFISITESSMIRRAASSKREWCHHAGVWCSVVVASYVDMGTAPQSLNSSSSLDIFSGGGGGSGSALYLYLSVPERFRFGKALRRTVNVYIWFGSVSAHAPSEWKLHRSEGDTPRHTDCNDTM
jgi:hypothetical protein